MIDWQFLAKVAVPLIALFVGVWLNRRTERRPVLLSHWGHVSSFNHQVGDGNSLVLNTHSVVIRNAGKRAATNVRLSHIHLPSFNIWPRVQYRVEEVPNSGSDIVIPVLVPKQHLTISYLYFPPITYEQVNDGIRCDEGFATHVPVLLQRQYPNWLNYAGIVLMALGLSTLVYGLAELGVFIAELVSK